MATRINYDITHAVAWPSKLKSQECGHIYNVELSEDCDNGAIIARGEWLELDLYAEAAASGFEGIIRGKAANGHWYVEVTKCDPTTSLFVYMQPFIAEEWTNKFKDERRWFNAKGDVVRAYELAVGDIFELSEEGFEGTPVAGATVSVSGKKVAVA